MPDKSNDSPIEPKFDETIHAPIRLRICGMLDAYGKLRFDALRDTLDVSDAVCSKHLKTLADRGYVTLSKKAERDSGKGYKVTWVSFTDVGRTAFQAHVAALKQIVAGG
ncbi:transcriptional regulator [Bifidobacterium vansinderenii]|uniref:ArsR family transcriptional regulator n=1 Tax=Bifidobacterium vansinderenii TaxID=1984871 RepID=A0A229VXZ6_9BIFI|nr:transcriptional regulator [Bifidobacterium vansinderenii]OXN00498.1 ArsR family transcriptional regulator [Bifidobacterium vansinderenii]